MMERRYTVAEIDALPAAVERRWLFGTAGPMTGTQVSRSYFGDEKEAAVEQRVRTHMQAGHTAQDLMAADQPATAR